MKTLTRVLAAVDFSQPARHAFEHALALSRRHGAGLVVVQAVPPDQPLSRHAAARQALIARLRRKADHANVTLTERVQQGDPTEIILLHARALRPDVSVVGSRQRRGIDRFKDGSVAERVALQATVPVLVVPGGPSADSIRPASHVAVAVDFSAASHRAIEQALALARDPADRLTLIHVVPGFPAGAPPLLYRYGVGEYQDQMIRNARRRLQLAVPESGRTAAGIDTVVLVGDVTGQIGGAVDRMGADLLVAGVPTRGVVSRSLFGSTAARLLRGIRLPLLTVPEVARPATREADAPRRAAA